MAAAVLGAGAAAEAEGSITAVLGAATAADEVLGTGAAADVLGAGGAANAEAEGSTAGAEEMDGIMMASGADEAEI